MTDASDTAPRPGADEKKSLRRGWTTGACATAATKAAFTGLLTGAVPDPVQIALPKGETPAFALALEETGEGWVRCGIVKDAGDDPDVTHGAMVIATVRHGVPGAGVMFGAGEGVGTVTLPGLPVPVGEPAINPRPREMMRAVIAEVAAAHDAGEDVEIELSIPGGAAIAEQTWNPRLGIVGGLSILGTTGIVHPFSCAAWIHSIHSGVDVARASGLAHIAGSTGSTSEDAVQAHYGLADIALIDMGDFAGGLLKYLRRHPVPRVTIAGGFAKISKLANGAMDLHSGRSQVDLDWMAGEIAGLGGTGELIAAVRRANTAGEVLELCEGESVPVAGRIAELACGHATAMLRSAPVRIEIMIVNRQGEIIAHAS